MSTRAPAGRITDIRATTVTVPLEAPILHANGAHHGRFDIEHTFRFLTQTLGLTRPRLRTGDQADRWVAPDRRPHPTAPGP